MNMISDNYEANNDGYALLFSDWKNKNIIRTMNLTQFIKFIKREKKNIEKSHVIHLHLRKSTNIISNEYIHLWKFKKWYCSHNGVLQNYNPNDSYGFFSSLKNFSTDYIKKRLENLYGYGLFIMTNLRKRKIIAGCANKTTNIILIDGILTIASSEYPLDNEVDIKITDGKTVKFLNLELNSISVEKFNFNVKEKNVYETETDNCVIELDYKKGKTKLEDLYPSYRNYGYRAPRYYDYYY